MQLGMDLHLAHQLHEWGPQGEESLFHKGRNVIELAGAATYRVRLAGHGKAHTVLPLSLLILSVLEAAS